MHDGVTLVVGGMGLRGIANIGALQAVREHPMRIERIVATGLGSLAAAQFSLGRDMNALTDYLLRFFAENRRKVWGLEESSEGPVTRRRRIASGLSYFLRERTFCRTNLKRLSILEWDFVEGALDELFGGVKPQDLKIPLAVSAIDLDQGKEVLLEGEGLTERLKAGIAFPGLFPPVRIGQRSLVSGAFFCELPLGTFTEADAPIVAIDLPYHPRSERPANVIETLARMDELRGRAIKRKLLEKADTVYTLEGVTGSRWGGYRQIPWQIATARREMETLLER